MKITDIGRECTKETGAKKLKAIITSMGYTQTKLAEITGKSKPTVSRYLSDPQSSPVDFADLVAEITAMTPRTFEEIFTPNLFAHHVRQGYYSARPE